MSSVLLDAMAVLEKYGYRTQLPGPTAAWFCFEDSNILGVLHVLDSVEMVVGQWEVLQDRFLRENGRRLSEEPLKAWNCYTILLTPEDARDTRAGTLSSIEEDFRGTRKLVRAGVATKADLETALAPILPLRHVRLLAPEAVKDRLGSRLENLGTPLSAVLADTSIETIAAALVDAE